MNTTIKIIDGNLYEYDANNNCIHFKNINGNEVTYDYDENNNLIHYKHSNGTEAWRNTFNNTIHVNYNGYNAYYKNGIEISKKEFESIQ